MGCRGFRHKSPSRRHDRLRGSDYRLSVQRQRGCNAPYSPCPLRRGTPSDRTPNHVSTHPLPRHLCRPRPRRSPPPLGRRPPAFAARQSSQRGCVGVSSRLRLPRAPPLLSRGVHKSPDLIHHRRGRKMR
jgi:hypothetical protein